MTAAAAKYTNENIHEQWRDTSSRVMPYPSVQGSVPAREALQNAARTLVS